MIDGSSVVTGKELLDEMLRLSKLIENGIEILKTATSDEATTEDAYRRAKAEAWIGWVSTGGKKDRVADREQAVVLATADERLKAKLAAAVKLSALEAVRARKTQLSALQTVSNSVKAEIELATYRHK